MTEPKTISELIRLIEKEGKAGNYKSAIIYLNKIIEIEPNDVRFYISRGTFKEHESCEDAIEDYTKAIEIDPNYHFAYFNRARVKYELGDYQGAIDDYSKIIEINPNHAFAYSNRARVKRKLGDNEGADEDDKKQRNSKIKKKIY